MTTGSQMIERLARTAYRHGVTPLDFAEHLTAALAEQAFRLGDKDPDATQFARHIVGGLLDSGWTMPASCPTCGRHLDETDGT